MLTDKDLLSAEEEASLRGKISELSSEIEANKVIIESFKTENEVIFANLIIHLFQRGTGLHMS